MFYLFENTWGWLLAALVVGLIVGWMTWSGVKRNGWLDGWAKWGAAIFVAGAVVALLRMFPGRWGLWVETALLFTFSYIVGCFLGGWLRAAFGAEEKAAPVVHAAAALSPSVEIFGHDTSGIYPGARPAALLAANGAADNLKLIREIGPLNEKFCNDIGVYHFAQIADWTPANAQWVDHHLGQTGLIDRENWVGQAKTLAKAAGAASVGVVAAAVVPHGAAVVPHGAGLVDGGAAAKAATAAKAEADRANAVRAAADAAEKARAGAGAGSSAAHGAALVDGDAARRAASASKAEADRAAAVRASADAAEAQRKSGSQATEAAAKADALRGDAARAVAKAEAERVEAARLAALKAETARAEAARMAAAKADAVRAASATKAAGEGASAAAAVSHPGARPPGAALAAGARGDDLKLIKGIGPKNERICNELGVNRFSEMAAWTPENSTWVGHHMAFPGRIERESWVPQARLLASGVDTDHSAAVKSGRITIDDSADAPLSASDAAALQQGLPQVAASVDGEHDHQGARPLGLIAPRGGKADDLKRIRGIGKQNEARLHGLGIWHFDQVARWSVDNVKWAGSYRAFPGRIDREKWIEQAVDLAAGRDTEFSKRVAAGQVPTSANDGTPGQNNKADATSKA